MKTITNSETTNLSCLSHSNQNVSFQSFCGQIDQTKWLKLCELDGGHLIEVPTNAGHLITFGMFLQFVTCDFNLWPFDVILNGLPGLLMDCPCGKFDDSSFRQTFYSLDCCWRE